MTSERGSAEQVRTGHEGVQAVGTKWLLMCKQWQDVRLNDVYNREGRGGRGRKGERKEKGKGEREEGE